MKHAKEKYNISLTTDPKIELYGSTEERMLFDLRVIIKSEEHFVKMKVYKTTCGIDFQALKHDIGLTFNHLDSLTVGEYVARNIVIDIANIL